MCSNNLGNMRDIICLLRLIMEKQFRAYYFKDILANLFEVNADAMKDTGENYG